MFSTTTHYLLFEFSEFWFSVKRDRATGDIHEWIIHRVREEWVPWWISLPVGRQSRIANDLASLTDEERKWFLQSLRTTIEEDCEKEGSPPNGRGSGDWVFMQLAHIEPFEGSQIFAAWRLDRVAGLKALCLHPNKSLPILSILLRRGDEPPHYEYNVRLSDAIGVSSALAAVTHLLKRGNPVFFNGHPRGCSHHPIALRFPLAASLIIGPLCIASVYVAAATGRLSEALLARLLYGACLSSMLFLIFWLIGLFSDWRTERRLAAALAGSQVAWALGNVLPSATSRSSLEIKGESFSAALALSILRSLAVREDGVNCWILWCLRRAARNMETLGITGDLSPTGTVLSVAGFGDAKNGKKAICIGDGLTLLSPDQKEATATVAEVAKGLHVRKCPSLEGMIWAAANHRPGFAASHRSGFVLWLGAVAATLLVLFSFCARDLILPSPALDLVVSQPPIIEDRPRHIQHLILHFRTKCSECFILRVHSTFWKTPSEQHLAQAKDSDNAVFEIELVPEEGATGDGMGSSVEIRRARLLPFLRLEPQPVDEITFARLNDMYERSRGVGKYAFPNH